MIRTNWLTKEKREIGNVRNFLEIFSFMMISVHGHYIKSGHCNYG
jgi:hypothetical protein